MDNQARIAFVIAQATCAQAEIAAMQAANAKAMRQAQRAIPPYGHEDFMAVQDRYLIGHNAVIEYLRDG